MSQNLSHRGRLRVGAVSYLNTKPLVFQFQELAPAADLILDVPSRLAQRLASGELDVALIPSIEFFQNPEYTIVSDACIACRGPVLSVKLLSRCPPARIRTLALDEGSRTSVAMVRVLLKQRFGVQPQLSALPLGSEITQTDADAILLIGDRAIHSPEGPFDEIWDLGDEWCRCTDLPFVFAMWTARKGVELGTLETAFEESRNRGMRHLEQIAREEAAAVGLTPDVCHRYLRDNLYFYLGEREQRGLHLFYEEAVKMELAPAKMELRFSGCTHS
jgi:chorismate dehydratase